MINYVAAKKTLNMLLISQKLSSKKIVIVFNPMIVKTNFRNENESKTWYI